MTQDEVSVGPEHTHGLASWDHHHKTGDNYHEHAPNTATRKDATMTKDEQGYNGWKNYETWAVALWIDNDEAEYDDTRQLAREIRTEYEAVDTDRVAEDEAQMIRRTTTGLLADALKARYAEEMPEIGPSMWGDLLAASFGQVDWYEIAENYLSEVNQDA